MTKRKCRAVPEVELLKSSLLPAMATAEKRQQHHWQQQRLRSAGKSRSQVRSGATTAVRSMTATAISMEFNQQQPPAENSHTQSPPPATHIYASVHPTTHPPTKLSVSQAFIQSVTHSVSQSVEVLVLVLNNIAKFHVRKLRE